MWEFTIDVMTNVTGLENVKRSLEYSNEYDLESLDYLLNMLKLAKEADASIEVQENLNKRIITKQNRSDSVYMNVYNQVRKFEPFAHLNSQLKANIILTLPDSSPQKALFLNFKQITEDIIANKGEVILNSFDTANLVSTDPVLSFNQDVNLTNTV